MSCIFVITPLVLATGGWPIFCAAAVAAAATMGYRKLQKSSRQVDVESDISNEVNEVEIAMDSCKIISDTMAEDERFVLVREGVQVEFLKDAAGRFSIHVQGRGMKTAALRQEGEKLIGRIRQQYAYQKIMNEMEKKGYALSSEKVDEDRRIHIRLERMAGK